MHIVNVASARGWETVRVNARGAGEGVHLSRHLPHAGRWLDVATVLAAHPWSPGTAGTPVIAAGMSLGGAILLSHLGETGACSGLDGAVAVNPPTDLAWSLRELERPANLVYHTYYAAALRRIMRLRTRLYPERYARPRLLRHTSVRALDEDYVARDAGHRSAEAYYAACSARTRLHGIRTPTWGREQLFFSQRKLKLLSPGSTSFSPGTSSLGTFTTES